MTDWPDVDAEVIGWLTPRYTGAVVAAELDNDLLADLPLIRVTRAAGDDDGVRLDRALVDVDVFAATRGAASALARNVRRDLLDNLRGTQTTQAVFGLVSTVAAPAWRPYDNTTLRRIGATYEIYLRPAV